MGFKTNSEDDEDVSKINITSLVDVMLLLVIILLATAPLTHTTGKCRFTQNNFRNTRYPKAR